MAISAPGLGSNLDVNGIVSQLMAVEARPLTRLATKEAGYQAKLTAIGSLKGALSAFQIAANGLNNISRFQTMSVKSGDAQVATATGTAQAAPGTYNINITQLAQAQTLVSRGQSSATNMLGSGAATTVNFQFGTIDGGTYVSQSARLSTSVANNGIPANSLILNGTTISTDASVNSAKLLADRINLASASTGVTALATATDSGALGNFTVVGGSGDYSLTVGGISVVAGAAAGFDAVALDMQLADPTLAADLAAAGIATTGSAQDGTLRFVRADGSNIAIQESGTGATGGFTSAVGLGKTVTHTSSISLSSATPVSVSGSNPAASGLVAGVQPTTYAGAGFNQNPNIASGTLTIDASNNTLQGIRDAINKAGLGVTATIVSDGSSTPHRLVITSTRTGEASSMKISVDGDEAISSLLAFDPAGTQNLRQTSTAQDTLLSVNGVSVRSGKPEVSDAIQGVTLTAVKTGSTSVTVARDTSAVTTAVNGFVKAYNDAQKTLKDLSAYNPDTKQAAVLNGDSTVRAMQTQLRNLLGANASGVAGGFSHLSDIGVTFQTDGTLAVNSTKLQKAITDNVDGVGALFATMGKPTDSLITYKTSTSATKPGTYDVYVSALATQGRTVGSAPAGLSITAGVNDKLSVTVNGVSASITLTAGNYSVENLVSHVQAAINGNSTLSKAGAAVNVSANAGVLTITSNSYGSTSNVSISGNGAESLLGTGSSTAGADVVGTIGGVAARGSGQDLIGAIGSAADGLRMTISGGATDASRGSITFSHGYAQQLGKLLDSYLGNSGPISERTKGLSNNIKDLGRQRDSINQQLALVEKRYRAQFAALDTMISSMNQTSQYLAQQLANLPKFE